MVTAKKVAWIGLFGSLALGAAMALGGGPQAAPPTRVATADVLGVVERMILSDRYRPAQEAFTASQNDKLKPLAEQIEALQTKGSAMPANSPDLEALLKEFDDKQAAFQKARQEALEAIDRFNADQVREAYRLTLESTQKMAAKRGYTQVLASRTGVATIRSNNVAGALQEILARPVAMSDSADDLTADLIKEFKLENVKVDDAPGLGGSPNGPGPQDKP